MSWPAHGDSSSMRGLSPATSPLDFSGGRSQSPLPRKAASLKVELVEGINLPRNLNLLCGATVLVTPNLQNLSDGEKNSLLQKFVREHLRGNLSEQLRTRASQSSASGNPEWRETFTISQAMYITDAQDLSSDFPKFALKPEDLTGESLTMLLISREEGGTSASMAIVNIPGIGGPYDQWHLLRDPDTNQQVYGELGKPAGLHIRYDYASAQTSRSPSAPHTYSTSPDAMNPLSSINPERRTGGLTSVPQPPASYNFSSSVRSRSPYSTLPSQGGRSSPTFNQASVPADYRAQRLSALDDTSGSLPAMRTASPFAAAAEMRANGLSPEYNGQHIHIQDMHQPVPRQGSAMGMPYVDYRGPVGNAPAGPKVVAPPKAQNKSVAVTRPERELMSESREANLLYQENLSMAEQVMSWDRAISPVAAIYESEGSSVVEGFLPCNKDIYLDPRSTKRTVIVRCCRSAENTMASVEAGAPVDTLHIEFCSNLRILVTSVAKHLVVIGCSDLELIIGGSAPQLTFIHVTNCTMVVCKDTWQSALNSVGSSGVNIQAAHFRGLGALEPRDLLGATMVEKVLLPDVLLASVHRGTMTTQCHFSQLSTKSGVGADTGSFSAAGHGSNGSAPSIYPQGHGPEAAASLRTNPRGTFDDRTLYDTEESRAASVMPSMPGSGKVGVGMLLKRSERGLKVVEVAQGGPAGRDGRVMEGDFIIALDGVPTEGKRLRDVGAELSGYEGSEINLTMRRFTVFGTTTFDVNLVRGPVVAELPPSQPSSALPPAQQANLRGSEDLYRNRTLHEMPSHLRGLEEGYQRDRTDKWSNRGFLLEEQSWKDMTNKLSEPSALPDKAARVPDLDPADVSERGTRDNQSQPIVGIGLGVRPSTDASYKISALVPNSVAERCGSIHLGDILHSVDGVPVCGKTYDTVRDLVRGPVGSRVVLAFLRPEARPENLMQTVDEFDWWRPVVLTRHMYGGGQAMPSQSSSPEPVQEEPPRREAVSVALWLEEDFDVVVGDGAQYDIFASRLEGDIAASLKTELSRVRVMDLMRGSVVADVHILPQQLQTHGDTRSPQRLAAEVAIMASDPTSPLRNAFTTRNATKAEVRGPVVEVSALRDAMMKGEISRPVLPTVPVANSVSGMQPSSQSRSKEYFPDASFGLAQEPKVDRSIPTIPNIGTMPAVSPQKTKSASPEASPTMPSATVTPEKSTHQPPPADIPQAVPSPSTTAQAHLPRKAGIGLEFGKLDTGEFEIVNVFPGGPAWTSGEISVGNLLKSVDSVNTTHRSLDEVVTMITGDPGTTVTLGVLRKSIGKDGRTQQSILSLVPLTRGQISNPDAHAETAAESTQEAKPAPPEPPQEPAAKPSDEPAAETALASKQKLLKSPSGNFTAEKDKLLRKTAEIQQQLEELEELNHLKEQQEMMEQMLKSKKKQEENLRKSLKQKQDALKEADQKIVDQYSSMSSASESQPLVAPSEIAQAVHLQRQIPDRSQIEANNAEAQTMVFNGAPRMVVLNRAPIKGMKQQKNSNVAGVGVSFQRLKPSELMMIIDVIAGGSAEASGELKVGDVIHLVNNVAVQGKRVPDVVAMIKGPIGSSVVLQVQSTSFVPKEMLMAGPGNLYTSNSGSAKGAPSESLPNRPNLRATTESLPPTPSKREDLMTAPGPSPPATSRSASRATAPSMAPVGQRSLNMDEAMMSAPAPAQSPQPFAVKIVRAPPPGQTVEAGQPVGIGLGFEQYPTGDFIITVLVPNCSAQQTGQIQVGDQIIAVDGKPVQGLDVENLIAKIKGPDGSTVELILSRAATMAVAQNRPHTGGPTSLQPVPAPPQPAPRPETAPPPPATQASKESVTVREEPAVPAHPMTSPSTSQRPATLPMAVAHTIGLHLSDQYPYTVRKSTGLVDTKGIEQGQSNYGNNVLSVGDTVLAINGTSIHARKHDEVLGLLSGSQGSIVDLLCSGTGQGSDEIFSVKVLRNLPLQSESVPEPPVKANESAREAPAASAQQPSLSPAAPVEAGPLPANAAAAAPQVPSPPPQPLSANRQQTIHTPSQVLHVKLLGLEGMDIPANHMSFVCRMVLRHPELIPTDPTLAKGQQKEQGFLDFNGFETAFSIETSKVQNSQVQFTIWDHETSAAPENFWGEVILNVGPLVQLVGKPIEYGFVLTQSIQYQTVHGIRGNLKLGLLLESGMIES